MSVESEHISVPVDSELHKKIKEEVLARRDFSQRKMQDYHTRWDEQDDTIRAYIPETELSSKRKNSKRFRREFDYISLELPYSFAVIMTAHTYWSTVFLSRSPVFQYTGRHGEPQNQIMAVEAIMDYQLSVGAMLPTLYNWLYDYAKYGVGIVGNYWDREETTVSRFIESPVSIVGIPISGRTKKERVEETLVGYEGNKLYNVRPHDFYPDPRVNLYDFQKGEYCGRRTISSYTSLQQQGYINIREAQKAASKKGGSSIAQSGVSEGSSNVWQAVQPSEEQGPGVATTDVLEMQIKVVPKAWDLSNSGNLETWVFTIAGDNVVIGARPQGLYHGKFPYSVIEYGMGTNEFVKLSMIDIMRPMTDTLSWLFNVHFFNVRKALNDVRVVDPSRIEMDDVMRPGAGGVYKLKPEAYGTNPKEAIHQLQVTDVTRTHLSDTQFVEAMVQRVTGVVDNLMGMVNTSGRKTATEVRTSTGFSTNRLKTPAEYASACGWSPLSAMMLQNTQQLYDEEKKFKIAGTLNLEGTTGQPGVPGGAVQVTPEDISGFYDFVPVDGTAPIDRLAQATFWKELLVQVASNPLIATEWDVGGMIAHAMKLTGERNIDRFRLSLQPDEKLMRQAALGNNVAIGGNSGQGGGTPPAAVGGIT
jgi:hypothetical protein